MVQLPTWSNVRCNWRLEPCDNAADWKIVEQAAAVVREVHPYIESTQDRTRREQYARADAMITTRAKNSRRHYSQRLGRLLG